jgi:hypothetical protein
MPPQRQKHISQNVGVAVTPFAAGASAAITYATRGNCVAAAAAPNVPAEIFRNRRRVRVLLMSTAPLCPFADAGRPVRSRAAMRPLPRANFDTHVRSRIDSEQIRFRIAHRRIAPSRWIKDSADRDCALRHTKRAKGRRHRRACAASRTARRRAFVDRAQQAALRLGDHVNAWLNPRDTENGEQRQAFVPVGRLAVRVRP